MLPKNLLGEVTAHPSSFVVHIFMYISILCLFQYVQMYIVPGTGCILYILYIFTSCHDCDTCSLLGTQRSPFYEPCRVFFISTTCEQEQDQVILHLGPMVPCKYCKYLPTTNLWIVFVFILVILSLNLVVSCPYVSYYLYLHIFMLFRSICSDIFL